MAEYIKRADTMTICERYSQHCFEQNDSHGQHIADGIFDDIVELPTADVVEVKHGKWVDVENKGKICSVCGKSALFDDFGTIFARSFHPLRSNFCPNCGARMDGERSETIDE